ncbi:hypothetical protein LSTR_LSTR017312 [Laodelphax striatellus]|uniref:Uncharacterized protein n=1 Tax=Laodelphax striatellus TaxID=195883 RepID=A0A482XIH0_LAOST|nr:hypothetical protein LSTR_LSTR017312 [Laodelphax striatellus]
MRINSRRIEKIFIGGEGGDEKENREHEGGEEERQQFHEHALLDHGHVLRVEHVGTRTGHRLQSPRQVGQYSRHAAELRVPRYVRRDQQLHQRASREQQL